MPYDAAIFMLLVLGFVSIFGLLFAVIELFPKGYKQHGLYLIFVPSIFFIVWGGIVINFNSNIKMKKIQEYKVQLTTSNRAFIEINKECIINVNTLLNQNFNAGDKVYRYENVNNGVIHSSLTEYRLK